MAAIKNHKVRAFVGVFLVLMLVLPLAILASDWEVIVVDVIEPFGSVTLEQGETAPINITINVSGNQVGTATFKVYRDWTLSDGSFEGSNPTQVTVSPQSGGTTTTYSTPGTVTVDASQAPREEPFILAVGVFDITNTNSTGAKLDTGDDSVYSAYEVTVVEASASCEIFGFYRPVNMGQDVVNVVRGGSTVPLKFTVECNGEPATTVEEIGAVFTVMSISYDSENNEVEQEIDLTVSGETELRYDMVERQFIQNWQTPRTPGYYRVTVTIKGGASISAEFRVR